MALILDPISSKSPGGERDYNIDLSGGLEFGESISTVDVVSGTPLVLTVTNPTKNADGISVDFHVAVTSGAANATVLLDIVYTGDSTSKDTYQAEQPIVDVLTG